MNYRQSSARLAEYRRQIADLQPELSQPLDFKRWPPSGGLFFVAYVAKRFCGFQSAQIG